MPARRRSAVRIPVGVASRVDVDNSQRWGGAPQPSRQRRYCYLPVYYEHVIVVRGSIPSWNLGWGGHFFFGGLPSRRG